MADEPGTNVIMDEGQKTEILHIGGKELEFDCPMKQYTTFRVGGRADVLYRAGDIETLQKMVSYLAEEDIPYMVLGKGSNLLVMDRGIKGVVITLCGGLAALEKGNGRDAAIRVGSGMSLADLIGDCGRMGLGGAEFLAGIPGTVGGAVAMNAGAWGEEIESIVSGIEVVDKHGQLTYRSRSGLDFSYRSLTLSSGTIITKVDLALKRQSPALITGRIADYLKKRKSMQPLAYPSGGSIFKNPPKAFAGKLIEDAGLKGERVGGAVISDQHANFILNTGGAKASDILALMDLVREEVRERTGIDLEPEIKVVGL